MQLELISIYSQKKLWKKKSTYISKNKALVLALYKCGPRCYECLHKFFVLPSKSTLRQYLGKIPLNVGSNEQLFNKLSE